MTVRAPRVLLVLVASGALACGSAVALDTLDGSTPADGGGDATTSDADTGAEASSFGDANAPLPDVRRYADAPTFPTDAACTGDGLAPGAGDPFPCATAGITCNAGSSYCGVFSGGRIFPQLGCHPLPCDCAPTAGCGCLEPLPDFCTCDVDAGGVTVWCSLP